MTRQLRYSSTLDLKAFSQRVVDAATVCCDDGSESDVRDALTSCFDLLLEERNNYYPTDPNLLEIVLVSSGTLGSRFQKQLESPEPFNVLLTGAILDQLTEQSPISANRLKKRVEEKTLEVIGGYRHELPLHLVSLESVVGQLEAWPKHLPRPLTYGSSDLGWHRNYHLF